MRVWKVDARDGDKDERTVMVFIALEAANKSQRGNAFCDWECRCWLNDNGGIT